LGDKKSSRLPDTDTEDLTDKIFRKAQEQGAQTAEQVQEEKKQSFSGSGQRLGSTPNVPQQQQQQQQQPTQQQQPPKEGESKTVTITFYKEGFTIDDGELRLFEEARNKEFLQAIDNGYVPREVAGMANEVMVNLVNKKAENYVPPPKVFKAFEGGGRTLSSSSSTQYVPPPTTGQSFSYKCDETKPFTTLQIRLHDGTKLTAKFNLSDTVQTVHQFVHHAKAVNKPFTLMTTFPRKVLDNPKLTIEEAGLKNAAIVQNL
jgi:UBX domain-containing protein 1